MNKEILTKEDIIVNIEAVCGDMVLVFDKNFNPIWMSEEEYDRIIEMC